jgi:hypothetical protein
VWRCVGLLATLAGCGRLDFNTLASDAGSGDGQLDDSQTGDTLVCPVSFAANMAAYWPLDESAGAMTFVDQSGHGHDLTCSPCPTAGIVGVVGNAASFFNSGNGYNDSIGTPSTGTLSTLTRLTVAAWVNLQMSADQAWILSNDRDCSGCGGPYRGFSLHVKYGTTSGFKVWSGSVDTYWSVVGPAQPVNEWHFLVGTYDGATVSFYIDGVLAQSKAAGTMQNPPSFNTSLGGMGAIPDNGMTGYLDEVMVLDRALTVGEVQDLMRGCR